MTDTPDILAGLVKPLPRAHAEHADLGWTLDLDLLAELANEPDFGYHISLEAAERVALTVEARVLAAIDTDKLRAVVEALEFVLEMSEPPERNCACHLSPPCGWCEEYAGIAEAHDFARAALADLTTRGDGP
jgi:hypothetical protein